MVAGLEEYGCPECGNCGIDSCWTCNEMWVQWTSELPPPPPPPGFPYNLEA